MKLSRIAFFLSFATFAATGCAATPDAASDDGAEDVEATADELQAGAYTYYAARRDFRRCVSPLCGGYWVSRVNRATTRCADKTYASECYVTDIDLSGLRLGAAEQALRDGIGGSAVTTRAIFRGVMKRETHPNFGTLGKFRATEGWSAPAPATMTGDFYKVSDSGIRCITYPCPTLREIKLNSSSRRNISGLDLSAVPATDADKQAAQQALFDDAVIAVGANVAGPSGPAGQGTSLAATQFFLRATASASGGGKAGDPCAADSACGPGLACCYPCGIQGCQNVCMQVPDGGRCPMFP